MTVILLGALLALLGVFACVAWVVRVEVWQEVRRDNVDGREDLGSDEKIERLLESDT